MSAAGFIVWLVLAAVLAALAATWLQLARHAVATRSLPYVVTAAVLGTFMGSEAFKDAWGPIGSQRGPSVGGFYIITSLIFGLCITVLAAFAAASPALVGEESD